MEGTLGFPGGKPGLPQRQNEKAGSQVTFLTWGQSSGQTEHKASSPLCRRLSGPRTFQAFFGVLVAVSVWGVSRALCSEEVSACRPLCLAASEACLPPAPLSGPTEQLGEGGGGAEVPLVPLPSCKHRALDAPASQCLLSLASGSLVGIRLRPPSFCPSFQK